ncbi:endo alpha-1 4 polygalactosaminidase precursor [Fusarium beomiforme]|uniref:alpha-galactosidase n=1 Tax=Fusarium beomiforme TaxID=44412 RepID=A0A9P5A5B9_9HYPO|nr:endo alpha-1 4 polygalactosaminidase precursor [Fusarium beomiforme]
MITLNRIVLSVLAITCSAVEAKPAATSSSNSFGLSEFKPGVEWEIAKIWDIDMGHGRGYPMIPLLKSAGNFVICYFNARAVQSWDKDIEQFPKSAAGHPLAYPYDSEERYLDIRFKLKPTDYTKYLKNLAVYAHSIKTKDDNPLLVGQKNMPEIAGDLVSTLVFAVLESCRGTTDPDEENRPFCQAFQTYIDAGKPVLQIEYPPSVAKTGKLSSSDNAYYCTPKDDDKGFGKVLKWASAQLDGWGQYCGEDPFRTPAIKE